MLRPPLKGIYTISSPSGPRKPPQVRPESRRIQVERRRRSAEAPVAAARRRAVTARVPRLPSTGWRLTNEPAARHRLSGLLHEEQFLRICPDHDTLGHVRSADVPDEPGTDRGDEEKHAAEHDDVERRVGV